MKKLLVLAIALGLFLGLGASLPISAQATGDDNKVTGMTITKRAAHKIGFKWNAVEDAGKYVMRVTRPSGKLVLKKKTDKTQALAKHLRPTRTYRFKVKAKVNGEFGVYSKTRKVKTKSEGVQSIDLSLCSSASCVSGEDTQKKTSLCWDVNGYSAMGFKLVWSRNPGPEYPTRSGDKYQYYSDPKTAQGEIYAFDGTGKYYVRACEYLGGKCGVYSNQIEVNLD
ncbi:fibronectin type III domain-containing protein [Patescibacteria group bacterium]|nr:fibronectin type III domain-containing protein [Patescibacteria group bacterium]MBU1673811.1 fibronectin type III domain-containing protein [Patescibacteria group bacterium]MBU1964058.1 fibronectin type III domain-containing protein [Patescibacteria group bacterium]